MNWGYLQEFWDAVSSSTLNAWEYTTDWFYNIGNAVAGAIGNLFEFINHSISDVFIFLGWLFQNLQYILVQFLTPVKFVFQFSKSFVNSAFTNPATTSEIWSFSTSTIEVFNTIPYWNQLTYAIGIALLVLVGIAILKLFLKS